MKLLLLADKESPYLWDHYRPGRLKEYDLMLSCGDLKASYLRFLVTMGRVPLLYVHGNHDLRYKTDPPEGCDCVEDKLVVVNGLRILGMGGSAFYGGKEHFYALWLNYCSGKLCRLFNAKLFSYNKHFRRHDC